MFFEIDILKNLAIFTGKHLKACKFIKKRLQHRYFPVSITKIYEYLDIKSISSNLLVNFGRVKRVIFLVLMFYSRIVLSLRGHSHI